MCRHNLDPYPCPRDKGALFINEPWLIDDYLREIGPYEAEPPKQEDNIRIYIPMDLNKNSILQRLHMLLLKYDELSEYNESNFLFDMGKIIDQIEIYDRVRYVRNMPEEGKHSEEAIQLVKEIIERLEQIPDAGAELQPFEIIDELKIEYLDD